MVVMESCDPVIQILRSCSHGPCCLTMSNASLGDARVTYITPIQAHQGNNHMPMKATPSPSYMLHRATQVATALFDKVLGHSDLTHSQVLVLLSIAENPGTSQKHVSELTSIDRSTLADVANRLVRKGLIRRQRSRTDARRYNLSLTRAGEDALADARPLIREVDKKLMAGLTPEEADACIRLLTKLVETPLNAACLVDAIADGQRVMA